MSWPPSLLGLPGAALCLACMAGCTAPRTPAAEPVSSAPQGSPPLKNVSIGPGKLDVGLNFRTRYEVFDNFNTLHYDEADDDLLLLRTRLSLGYRLAEANRFFVEFQDARYTLNRMKRGDFALSCPYYDPFDLRQAWWEWRQMGGSPWSFKAGRQSLLYADRRLFAPAEWGNVGNYWWDGAVLKFERPAISVEAFYAQRVLSEPERWNFRHHPYHVGGLYVRWRQLAVPVDTFYVIKHDWSGGVAGESGQGNEIRHTFGVFSERPEGQAWDYTFFAAGQTGEYGQDAIRAYGLIVRGGYTFAAAWRPRVGAEFSYASGDRHPNDGVAGTFDGIFGGMAMPYGWMNVVSWKNLEDYALNFSVQPKSRWKFGVEYHYFRLAQSRDAWYWVNGRAEQRDPTGKAGRDLGHEVDVVLRWQATAALELMAGFGHFFAGGYIGQRLTGRPDAQWGFLQATLYY